MRGTRRAERTTTIRSDGEHGGGQGGSGVETYTGPWVGSKMASGGNPERKPLSWYVSDSVNVSASTTTGAVRARMASAKSAPRAGIARGKR